MEAVAGDSEVVAEADAPGAVGISAVAAVVGLLSEALRRSIALRLRRLDPRHQQHVPTWEVEVLVRAIDRPFNRDRGRVAESPPDHVPQHNRVFVPVAEPALDRDKESVLARGLPIVRRRVRGK